MKKIILSSLILSSLIFSGCQIGENTISPIPENNDKISVITSFYPLAFFTEEIAGGHAVVTNLSGSQSPHAYKISPRDRANLSNADLIIYQGIGLESWTEDLIPELEKNGIAIVEASHDLELKKRKEHDEYDEEEYDPHTWLDPILAQQTADNIAEKLIEIDPENTADYQKNLQNLKSRLQNLDMLYKESLSNCSQEALVSHNALEYLEKRYNFDLHPIAGISPSDEPSAKLLAELKELVEHEKITHILTEENNVKKYAQMLSNETGLQMDSINPMGTTPKNGNYFDVSEKNISILHKALQCQ